MPIDVDFADTPNGNALADFNACCEVADGRQSERLLDLFYDFLLERLARKSSKRLAIEYASKRVWRSEQGCAVYKTSDTPCVAYSLIYYDGVPTILVLGFCVDYPGSEEAWWNDVVRPRLIHHL